MAFLVLALQQLGASLRSMKVTIEREKKLLELPGKRTGRELLAELGINPSEVLLVRNNEIILADELLSDTDEITILSVVSGG